METDGGSLDRLASCYFCGVAVEAPLEEYPVVPRDLRPSVADQSTVVLCPDCRRKLSTIVERVVDATTEPGQEDLSDDTAQKTLDGDVTSTGERSRDDSVLAGFDHGSPDLLDVNERRNTSDERDHSEAERDATRADPSAEETESHESDGTDGEGTDAGGDRPGAGSDESSPSEAPPTQERVFSQSSYNRVVKLLQNRQFPVEHDDIVTIADSAYDIDRAESRAIIDALADRGVLDRDGDRLVRPDDTAQE